MFRRLLADTRGDTTIAYGLILVLTSVVGIISLAGLGDNPTNACGGFVGDLGGDAAEVSLAATAADLYQFCR